MNITQRNPKLRKPLQIDHETGEIVIPGFGRLPLVGPTSGAEYKRLKESEELKRAMNKRLVMLMSTVYLCVQCKRRVPGHRAIAKAKWNEERKEFEPVLSCPWSVAEGKCRGDLVPLAPGGKAA